MGAILPGGGIRYDLADQTGSEVPSVEHEILYRPSYSMLMVRLAAGEQVVAEAGAMVSMSGGVEVQTTTRGGLFAGLRRAVLGGESFFVNTFTARADGEVAFAPPVSGDVIHLRVGGQPVLAQSTAFLASAASVQVDSKWGGARSFFAGEGFFLLRLTGEGDAFLSSYGAIHERPLAAGERYVVDTGHIVAFDGAVGYEVRRIGGLKTTLFGGEGLVAEFTGPGRVWLQSRSPGAFLDWLIPHLPKPSGGGGSSGE
jgi:uncharacterized protein (TIGR00266 family)